MHEKRTYVSGKITGYDINFAKRKFKKTSLLLIEAGRVPVNPFDISEYHPDKKWADYMLEDIKELFSCEAIVMHSDWRESRGAQIELAIAEILGFEIIYEEDLRKLKKK